MFLGAFGTIRLLSLGVAALAVASVFAYIYYLRSENQVLEANTQKLEASIGVLQGSVATLKQNAAEYRAAVEKYTNEMEALRAAGEVNRSELRKLNETLSKHDLGELARKKPGLIERRLRGGTQRMYEELQEAGR